MKSLARPPSRGLPNLRCVAVTCRHSDLQAQGLDARNACNGGVQCSGCRWPKGPVGGSNPGIEADLEDLC